MCSPFFLSSSPGDLGCRTLPTSTVAMEFGYLHDPQSSYDFNNLDWWNDDNMEFLVSHS